MTDHGYSNRTQPYRGIIVTVPPREIHRRVRAQQLCDAIADCHTEDAMEIMSAALEDFETAGPFVSLLDIREDANFWADCASPRELEVYFAAILRILGKRAFALKARKRLFISLWESLTDTDRLSFISKVDPDLKFVWRTAS